MSIIQEASAATKAPDAGDIVLVDLSPVKGHEQGGSRPVLVVSPYTYNSHTGLALIVPLTSRIKGYPFEVPLGDATPQPSVALADSVRSIDWRERRVSRRGRVSSQVLAQVRTKLALVMGLRQNPSK